MNSQESLEFAKKYLADLLTFYGVNVEVEAVLSEDVIELTVPSNDSNSLLIGKNAETLRSLQFLLSTALRNKGSDTVRVNIDIADYKKQRAEKIAKQTEEWIAEVLQTGEPHVARLNAADRRIVHHIAGEHSEVRTYSEGEGRDRRIIITKQDS